jgi:hypothetical protein
MQTQTAFGNDLTTFYANPVWELDLVTKRYSRKFTYCPTREATGRRQSPSQSGNCACDYVRQKHERDASRRRYDGTVLRRSCCENIAESAFNEMNSTTFLAQTVSPAWTTPTPSLELFEERRARQQRENPATTGLPGVDTPGRRTRMAPRRPS